jgi:hypothetical protein
MIERIKDFVVYNVWYRFAFYVTVWVHEVKYAHQRVFRGYDDFFVWEYHLENSIQTQTVLKQLRDTKVGYPSDLTEEKWDDILDKIILGFEAVQKLSEGVWIEDETGEVDLNATEENNKRLEKIWQKGAQLYIKHYLDLWD